MENNNYRNKCRICNCSGIIEFLNLGNLPLANNLLLSIDEKKETFPLSLAFCPECYLVQLTNVISPDKLFKNYLYSSSTIKTLDNHFKDLSNILKHKYGLNNKSFVIDIGSNDGILLKHWKEHGIKYIGIEPSTNLSKIANDNDLTTINDYFNIKSALKIRKTYGRVNIITLSNVFAHIDNIKDTLISFNILLKKNGVVVIEVPYVFDMLDNLTFDLIYHEHLSYFSVTSLNKLFSDNGFKIVDIEHIDIHGGSIRVYITRKESDFDGGLTWNNYLHYEKTRDVNNLNIYDNFSKIVYNLRDIIREDLMNYKEGTMLVGFGAPAKCTTLLNFLGEDVSKTIKYIIDESEFKRGKYVPGVRIPILGLDSLLAYPQPDIIIVFAWNYLEEIKNKSLEWEIGEQNVLIHFKI